MREKAIFAAGCFWGVEDAFMQQEGVLSTVVGYTGGKVEKPSYREVCTDTTGHAEAVAVEYDPEKVSYEQLLDLFWKIHNPTTLNQQGPDMGSQYRSAIFYCSPEQEKVARIAIEALEKSGRFSRPVVTQVVPAVPFYEAEEYHQKYNLKHGRHCST